MERRTLTCNRVLCLTIGSFFSVAASALLMGLIGHGIENYVLFILIGLGMLLLLAGIFFSDKACERFTSWF